MTGRAAATRVAPRTRPFAERRRIADIVRRTAKDAAEADVPGLAAEMAHHSLFALVSLLLLLAGLTAVADEIAGIENMRERLINSAKDVLPQNASVVLEAFLNDVVESRGQGAILFGLAGVAWAGSNLVGSAMKGLNRIYRTEDRRGFLERKLLAITLAMALGTMVIGATIVVVFRTVLADGINSAIGSRAASEFVMTVIAWPLALMLVALATAVLYWKGPDRDEGFRWVTPGAVLFASAWVGASVVASVYLSHAGSPNRTYGLIAAVLVTIVWLYWSNLLFLAGAVLNVQVEDVKTHDSTGDRAERPADAQP